VHSDSYVVPYLGTYFFLLLPTSITPHLTKQRKVDNTS
jgi:hypothetical protein